MERKKLDTTIIEMAGANPNHKAIERLDRIKRMEKAKRKEQVAKAWMLIRLGISGFCAWFAIWHVDVITKNALVLLESVGVIACIGFIAITVGDIWEEADGQ